MRPKLLEIEGLQSFRDVQKIDFDQLGETGLFGIFGPTGSGKSTVLDAITFALYGKVRRAERGTQGIINANLNIAKVSFTFTLIKDGARKAYRVERVYQRKKGSENSCEPKVARLIEVTAVGDIPVCDKASEVSSSIEELLGLSHDDFTRAVVLPQNSFQEFLLLDNAKKREMLERIFYLEEYGKQLWERLSRKMSRLKSQKDQLFGELSAYADASDEALEAAQKAMDTAARDRSRVERELISLEKKYNEAKEVWQLTQELTQVSQNEQQHLAGQAAVHAKKMQLEKAVKADGLQEYIEKNKELSIKVDETEKQLREVKEKLPGVIFSLNEKRQKQNDLKREVETEQPKLVELKTRLASALDLKAELEVIRQKVDALQAVAAQLSIEATDKNGTIEQETVELEGLEQSLNQFRMEMDSLKITPEYRELIQEGAALENQVETLGGNITDLNKKGVTADSVVAELEQKLKQKKDAVALCQQAVDDMFAEQQQAVKPDDRNSLLQYREGLHRLQGVYDLLSLRRTELVGIENKSTKQQSELKTLKENIDDLEDERLKAVVLLDHSRAELDRATAEKERNTAFVLAKNLKVGVACPVCGSRHHPRLAVHDGRHEQALLEQQMETAKKRLTEAEKALKEVEYSCLATNGQMNNLIQLIDQTSRELELKISEYNNIRLRLPVELRSLELEQLPMELDRMNILSAEKLKAIETWEKEQEEFQVEIEKLNKQLSEEKLQENGIAHELKVNLEHREELSTTLNDTARNFIVNMQKHREFLQQHRIASVAAELRRLTENDRKMHTLEIRHLEGQQLLRRKRLYVEELKEQLRVLSTKMIKIEIESSSLIRQINQNELKMKELTGNASTDVNIEDEIKGIDEKLEQYLKLSNDYQESISILETQHHQLASQNAAMDNQQIIYSESLKTEQDRLNKSLHEKGFANANEVERSLISKESQKSLSDEIIFYEQAERNIQVQKDTLLKKLGSRRIAEEKWKHLSETYQGLAILKEECVSSSEVARNNFNLLKARHDKWVELNRGYHEVNNKHGLLEQIQKLLRAERGKDNSFIDFIAEERLRYVAARASETLGVMTKYKYALELDTSAGFMIRDNANGGVHRSVSSLSGGETFLTSLALALALSEQIQLKGQSPLEFFFLDEGFGTLDNNLLDTVIDSLERLSSKDRVIGIISHVPELRSRIARRLFVEPPTAHGEGSRTKIEKA